MAKYRITTNPGGRCPLKVERRYLGIWYIVEFGHLTIDLEDRIRTNIARKRDGKIKKEILKEFEV